MNVYLLFIQEFGEYLIQISNTTIIYDLILLKVLLMNQWFPLYSSLNRILNFQRTLKKISTSIIINMMIKFLL